MIADHVANNRAKLYEPALSISVRQPTKCTWFCLFLWVLFLDALKSKPKGHPHICWVLKKTQPISRSRSNSSKHLASKPWAHINKNSWLTQKVARVVKHPVTNGMSSIKCFVSTPTPRLTQHTSLPKLPAFFTWVRFKPGIWTGFSFWLP